MKTHKEIAAVLIERAFDSMADTVDQVLDELLLKCEDYADSRYTCFHNEINTLILIFNSTAELFGYVPEDAEGLAERYATVRQKLLHKLKELELSFEGGATEAFFVMRELTIRNFRWDGPTG